MSKDTSSPIIRVPVTNSLGAYNAGDVIGGILTVRDGSSTGAEPLLAGKTGVLKHITVKEIGTQKADLAIVLFDQLPTGTYTDNGAFDWGVGDFAKCIGIVLIDDANYVTLDGHNIATVEVSRSVQNKESGEPRCIYAIIVANGSTPDYVTAADLELQFGFIQD